jgi:hypothetical protein
MNNSLRHHGLAVRKCDFRVVEGSHMCKSASNCLHHHRPKAPPRNNTSCIYALMEQLAAVEADTVIDLAGKIVVGHGTFRECSLLLAKDGVTLRNGTLIMPSSSRLEIRGNRVRLENLIVQRGRLAAWEMKEMDLVQVQAAEGVVIEKCRVKGGGVLVHQGATNVQITDCDVSKSPFGGLIVRGQNTSVTAIDTVAHGNNSLTPWGAGGYGFYVGNHASLQLVNCKARDNRGAALCLGSHGCLVATNCIIEGNKVALFSENDGSFKDGKYSTIGSFALHACTITGLISTNASVEYGVGTTVDPQA